MQILCFSNNPLISLSFFRWCIISKMILLFQQCSWTFNFFACKCICLLANSTFFSLGASVTSVVLLSSSLS
jgi:hypothetical protein